MPKYVITISSSETCTLSTLKGVAGHDYRAHRPIIHNM